MNLRPDTFKDLTARLATLDAELSGHRRAMERIEQEASVLRAAVRFYEANGKQPGTSSIIIANSNRAECIREALKQLGTATPSEVVQRMSRIGFSWVGAGREPNGIVATELHRMAQSSRGRVERVAVGKYRYRKE